MDLYPQQRNQTNLSNVLNTNVNEFDHNGDSVFLGKQFYDESLLVGDNVGDQLRDCIWEEKMIDFIDA